MKNIRKRFFKAYILSKKVREKNNFFDQNHGLTPLKNPVLVSLKNEQFYGLERVVLNLQHQKTIFPDLFCQKKPTRKECELFLSKS